MIRGSPYFVELAKSAGDRAAVSLMITALKSQGLIRQRLGMKPGFLILNLVRRMLGKILVCIHDNFDEEEDISSLYDLPDDVKEGHFVVHAVDDGELRRFVVELSYLAHPGFLKLLQQAEEEFGYRQKGILAVPCGYSDLQRLLESKEEKKGW